MSVVIDASVFIFLGKLKRLPLLKKLFKGPFYTTDLAKDELLAAVPSPEIFHLKKELTWFKIVSYRPSLRLQGALSQADWSVVQAAERMNAGVVLADDKLLRNVLRGMNYQVLGTPGLLIRAASAKLLTRKAARQALAELISRHRFYLGAETYQLFLKQLEE